MRTEDLRALSLLLTTERPADIVQRVLPRLAGRYYETSATLLEVQFASWLAGLDDGSLERLAQFVREQGPQCADTAGDARRDAELRAAEERLEAARSAVIAAASALAGALEPVQPHDLVAELRSALGALEHEVDGWDAQFGAGEW